VAWIDLQLLFDFRAALLAAINRRQEAVPKAVTGVLLQGGEDVQAFFLDWSWVARQDAKIQESRFPASFVCIVDS